MSIGLQVVCAFGNDGFVWSIVGQSWIEFLYIRFLFVCFYFFTDNEWMMYDQANHGINRKTVFTKRFFFENTNMNDTFKSDVVHSQKSQNFYTSFLYCVHTQ